MASCAALSGRDQFVLVTSNPSGAEVFDRGKLIGRTPGYLAIRRNDKTTLELRFPDNSKKPLALKSKYRWWGSFGANFLFLIYAPIGWGVDWYTGAAYEFEDPPIEKTDLAAGSRIAIAPPTGEFKEMANSLGMQIEAKLSREGKYKVVPYGETFAKFEFFDAKDNLPATPEDRREFLTSLNADAILFSQTKGKGPGQIAANSQIRNVYSGKDIDDRSFELNPDQDYIKTRARYGRLFHILPNTVFVNFSDYYATMSIGGQEIKGSGVKDGSTIEAVSRYVGAIGIGRLERPRKSHMGKFNFEFVPTANFSIKRMRMPLGTPPSDQDFDRTYISAGYGLEVGYHWSYGYPYFDIFPQVLWTKLTYDAGGRERSRERWSSHFALEVGYMYFVNQHIVIKAFNRGLQEDTSLWSLAVSDVLGAETKVNSAQSSFSGAAVGLMF